MPLRSQSSSSHRRANPRPPLHRGRPPLLFLLLLLLSAASLLLCLALLSSAAAYFLGSPNALGRRCFPPAGYGEGAAHPGTRPSIAMVSLSDEGLSGGGGGGRRSFRGVGEAVAGNKRAYAAAMGYEYVDASGLVDRSRPPSWSKILAVRSLLPRYDWVFWNDADTMVMNPKISLESILHAAIGHVDFEKSPDLVVTEDINGVNAGVFFVRRSEWSERFLQTWWNQSSFIRFGSTKSGDNDALKWLIHSRLSPRDELRAHVAVAPMQCLFNSYPWEPTPKSIRRLLTSPRSIWNGAYSDGDFMLHLAGIDDKKKWVANMLRELASRV